MKIKQRYIITNPKKKWPKLGKLTIPNAGENVEQQKLLLLVGMQNGIALLKENLAVPYKN